MVSVLLRFKDSDYPFGICKLFLPVSEYLLISVSQMTMSFFPLSCFTNTVVSNHFHSVKKKIVSSARSRDSDGMDFNTCIIVHSIRFTLLVFSYFYAPCSCVCVLEFVLYDFLLLSFLLCWGSNFIFDICIHLRILVSKAISLLYDVHLV